MAMKKAIIHISDLHVAAKELAGKVDNSLRSNKTWLVAQPDEKNHYYIKDFCDYIKNHCKGYELYLIVSGDVADSSDYNEYIYAAQFIQQIMDQLSILKNRVLIVPGNHDINRNECENQARQADEKSAYLCNEGKYKQFAEFYHSLLNKTFPINSSIVDVLKLDEEKLLFVGVNSNYKIGYKDGYGAVDINDFKSAMTKYKEQYSDYEKIAVFHHNIYANYENNTSHYGSWEKDEWLNFKRELEYFGFRCLLYGNEHTRSSDRVPNMTIYYSDSGSFGLKEPAPSFKIYKVQHTNTKTSLRQELIKVDNDHKTQERAFGVWVERKIEDTSEMKEFILRNKQRSKTAGKRTPGIKDSIPHQTIEPKQNEIQQDQLNGQFCKYLMGVLKKDNLYHQGHFHWGQSSRSLNWIDTISLLSDRNYSRLIQREIIRTVQHNNIQYDIIIGIGIEGNIMSAPLFTNDRPYTYLPYPYRYEEANDCEKSLCVENKDGKYKKVLVLTDVVHQGRTLKSLFEEKESVFFKKVIQINVLSLFFTGGIRLKGLPKGLSEMRDKVRYFSLMDIDVGKCPFGDDYRTSCFNYVHRLCEVFKFYNEQ